MTIYHYNNSPLIDHIKVDTSHHGIARATIVAAANADGQKLEELRKGLGAKEFSTLMDTADGRAIIQVWGFKDGEALQQVIGNLGLAAEGVTEETNPEDKKPLSFGEKVRGKATFLSALWYDMGNIACVVSGFLHGRHNPGGKFTANDRSEMMTGVTFGIGDALMTFFGDNKGDEELKAAAWGLKRHLHQKGIKMPQGDELNPDTLHKSGALKATERWLRKHIIHIKCLSETTAGLFMIHAGLKKDNRNNGKIVAGALLATGWMATFLLDKPRGHHIFDDDLNGSASFADKMANNPRGWLARPLSIGNNVANIIGSLREKPKTPAGKNDYLASIVSASSFLVANSLFGLSDAKRLTQTDDDKIVMNDLVLLAANVLAKQPEAVCNVILSETAEYISGLAHVRMTKDQVESAIRDKVESLTRSGWASRVEMEPAPGLRR